MALDGLIGLVIHRLVVGERVPAIERGVAVLPVRENVLKDQFRGLLKNGAGIHLLPLDLTVDLLLLIGQKHVDPAVFLDKHLPRQDLQRLLHPPFQLQTVRIQAVNHQAGDVISVRLDLRHIFYQEQRLQNIDGKHAAVFPLRIDAAVVVGPDNNALVGVIQKILHGVVEHMKGNQYAGLLCFQPLSGLFEHGQHGPLSLGEVLAGGAVGPHGSQHAGQEVELIAHKGIDLRKAGTIRVELLFGIAGEEDLIAQVRLPLFIQQPQRLRRRIVFIQDSPPDHLVHIGGGQGQPGVKPPLNLGEVVALYVGDGVDVLLAGHNDPGLSPALPAQLLRDRLEVQHQPGVLANILADLVHQKYHMVVPAPAVYVGPDPFGKILNADLIGLHRLFAPVPGRGFTHEAHAGQRLDNGVLNKVEVLPGILPGLSVRLLKGAPERLKAPLLQ